MYLIEYSTQIYPLTLSLLKFLQQYSSYIFYLSKWLFPPIYHIHLLNLNLNKNSIDRDRSFSKREATSLLEKGRFAIWRTILEARCRIGQLVPSARLRVVQYATFVSHNFNIAFIAADSYAWHGITASH